MARVFDEMWLKDEQMYELAKDRLKIGSRVKITFMTKTNTGSVRTTVRHGTLAEICKHFIVVQMANHKECFQYIHLFGNTDTKVAVSK